MRKGTTPTHSFVLPFSTGLIQEVEITYHQNGEEVLTKYKDDATFAGNTVSVTLTQDETFEFNEDVNVEIQIRVLTSEGMVAASDIIRIGCNRCLSNEVL